MVSGGERNPAVQLDERLGASRQLRVHDRREADDRALAAQPIGPALDRRRREPDSLPDPGVALPGVADELGNDLPVQVVDLQRSPVLRNGTRAADGAVAPYGRFMTVPLLEVAAMSEAFPDRASRRRRYLMCPPQFFDVSYSINPWMDRSVPVDRARAAAQWEPPRRDLRGSRSRRSSSSSPLPGAPDMVFSANGAVGRGRAGVDGAVPPSRTCARAAPVPAVVRRARIPRGPPRPGDLRGRRRCDVRRLDRARRLGVPDDPERAPRGPGVLRPAGRESSPLRPALLPPRHGALRPRRAHRRVLPARVLRRQSLRARTALPGRDPRGRSRTRTRSGSTR